MMQAKSFELIEAITEAKLMNHQLNEQRNGDVTWDDLFDKATDLASKVDEVPPIPRVAGRAMFR